MNATMDARTKMTKARAGLVLDRPFFGSLSLRLKLQENPAVYCMRTDGKILQFNPNRIDELSLDHVKGIIAHEVMHVALEHQARFQNRKFRLIDKNLLFIVGSIRNGVLCVKKILTTKCRVPHQ